MVSQGATKDYPNTWEALGCKINGALDYETGEVFCVQEEQYTAKEFLSFLEKVIIKYPRQRIVMILDNIKIHRANLILPFLENNKALLQLVYLPPYSPNLNLIEGLWGWIKSSVIYNVFFDSVMKIRKAVQGFVKEINKTPMATVDRLCLKLQINYAEYISFKLFLFQKIRKY